jgi:hypothetical protein
MSSDPMINRPPTTATTSPVAARHPGTAVLWVLLVVSVLANVTASTVLDNPYVGAVTGALVLGSVAALVLRARSARTGA